MMVKKRIKRVKIKKKQRKKRKLKEPDKGKQVDKIIEDLESM
jgi:hypothetical protein